jgi:glycosyltransferase involved in cell wall biosynthesis
LPPFRFSVVICAYTEDRLDNIYAAIASVHNQNRPGAEIILVIDNNPTLYKRLLDELTDVTIVENAAGPGLSGARNTGIGHAHGEIVVFLDDDATAEPDWLNSLDRAYANPDIIGVGGLTLPQWQTARPHWFPEEFYWVVGCNYTGMPTSGQRVRNLLGANMSFRREAFSLVDGFRAGVGRTSSGRPLGCEETEFCIRLGQRSPRSILTIEHRAVVRHLVPDIRCRFSYFISRCFAEGISKALVTGTVGSEDGLSAERDYTTRTLPLGVLKGVADLFRGDPGGLGRATAILVGLSVTVSGYMFGRFRSTRVGYVS